jgi:hypothetical protein
MRHRSCDITQASLIATQPFGNSTKSGIRRARLGGILLNLPIVGPRLNFFFACVVGCAPRLHVGGGRSTSDNFDQLSRNDGLTGTVEENLVLVDHLASVLGGVLYGRWKMVISIRSFRRTDKEGLSCNSHPWHFDGPRSRRRGLQPGPSRGSWPGRTRAG